MKSRPYLLLRAFETALATLGGGALGGALGLLGGTPAAIALGSAAGLNGILGGFRQVYDWRTGKGWFAFAADSTWGLAGTTLGTLLHLVNLARPGAAYRADLSHRRNRHWFDGGARLRPGFVWTLGNVVSSTPAGRPPMTPEQYEVVEHHEGIHVWQNRIFGPLYPIGYAAWFVLGLVVGIITWVIRRGDPGLFRLVETAAYYDNPFEYWAYARTGRWKDNPADPTLKWRRPGWLKEKRSGD